MEATKESVRKQAEESWDALSRLNPMGVTRESYAAACVAQWEDLKNRREAIKAGQEVGHVMGATMSAALGSPSHSNGGHMTASDSLSAAAGGEFDVSMGPRNLGFNRDQWIRARMMAANLDPESKTPGTWFGPSNGGTAKMSSEQQNAVFSAEYQADRERLVHMGCQEADYVKTRRIDVGLDQLVRPGKR